MYDNGIPESVALQAEREIVEAIVAQDLGATYVPDNACDHCKGEAELYHNEATGLSLCEACDIATETPVRFKKLRNGAWGVTGPSALIEAEAEVVVTKRSGATNVVTIKRVLWSGDGKAIATIAR